jgi:hypothetical protein
MDVWFASNGSAAEAQGALAEIERLVRDATAAGVRLDPWLEELADELRAVVPLANPGEALLIAERIASDPRVSRAAQGRLRSETVKALQS